MKRIIMPILAVLLTMGLFAQPPSQLSDKKAPPQMNLEELQKILDLTDEQMVAMKALREAHEQQRTEQREIRQENMEAMKIERQQMQAEHHAALEKILTPEQLKKLDAMHAEKHKAHQHGEGYQKHGPDDR